LRADLPTPAIENWLLTQPLSILIQRSQKIYTMKNLFAAALCAALTLSACATAPTAAPSDAVVSSPATAGNITVTNAWARPALAMKMDVVTETAGHSMDGPVSGAYMIIENKGAADKLLSLSTSVAEAAEIHQTTESNGMMMMEPMPDGIDIPANGKVEFKPGSYHITLMNIKEDLKPGNTISLTLKFQSGQEMLVVVPVRENQ